MAGAYLEPISHPFGFLKQLELPQIWYSVKGHDLDHTVPVGAILGHFGVILELRARGWGLFVAYFSPVWLHKMT